MRDFFERNRRIVWGKCNKVKLLQKTCSQSKRRIEEKDNSFNYKLIQYVCEEKKSNMDISSWGNEDNLGHNKIECDGLPADDKESESIINTIRHMMNAKPDIAVIYEENKEKDLLFLECKFESREDSYESGFKQRQIQWKVANFLCNSYLEKKEIKVSDKMKNNESCLVQFVRKEPRKPEEISIHDLIRLNEAIFS